MRTYQDVPESFWRHRILWGLKAGVSLAVTLGACAILLYLLEGPQPFRDIQMPLQTFLLVYAINAVISGLILGLSRPILATVTGCAVIGLVVGLVLGATFGVFDPRGTWSGLDTIFTVSFGFTGLVSGIMTFQRLRQIDTSRRSRDDTAGDR